MKSELREIIKEVLDEHGIEDEGDVTNDILNKCVDRFDAIENDEEEDDEEG